MLTIYFVPKTHKKFLKKTILVFLIGQTQYSLLNNKLKLNERVFVWFACDGRPTVPCVTANVETIVEPEAWKVARR